MDAKKVHVGRPGQVLLSVVGGVQRGRRGKARKDQLDGGRRGAVA